MLHGIPVITGWRGDKIFKLNDLGRLCGLSLPNGAEAVDYSSGGGLG